jgi:SAM-dependent methyltransferase
MSIDAQMPVEEIMERVRERVRLRRQASNLGAIQPSTEPKGPAEAPAETYDLGELRRNLADCNLSHSAVGTINPRRPGPHNSLIQFLKKVMRRSLTWYTRPLHSFHGSVIRTLNEATRAIEDLQLRLVNLEKQRESGRNAFESSLRGLQDVITTSEQRLRSEPREELHLLKTAVSNHDNEIVSYGRNMRRLIHSLATQGEDSRIAASYEPKPLLTSEMQPDSEFDYFLFEEHFRGDESVIKARQTAYLEYFIGKRDVLDLGCGRGEFLELMRENGIRARGAEINLDMFLLCQGKGLDVVQMDLFSCLESVPDGSLGGIFCSQVIEHLSSKQLLELATLAKHKLAPESAVVLETINPECLVALARNFFLDPTHVRPVHPETLQFLLKSLGFKRVELKFSSRVDSSRHVPPLPFPDSSHEAALFNQAMQGVNQLLYGYQDYAASAVR